MMDRILNPSIVDSTAVLTKPNPTPSSIDWNLVHFNVGCARCGHDLRGLSDPTCPSCSLEFDWVDAAPIERLTCSKCGYHLYGLQETRCPECGEVFTWQDALAAYHRNRQPLFEFQWRTRPVRAFVTSLRRALRPRKHWRSLTMHDAAPAGGLVLLGLCVLILFTGLPLALVALGSPAMDVLERYQGASTMYGRYVGPWEQRFPKGWTVWLTVVPATVGFWLVASIGALFLPWQSVRTFRVRGQHIARAVFYSTLPLAVIPAALCVFAFVVDVMSMFVALDSLLASAYLSLLYHLGDTVSVVAIVAWVWVVRSLRLAYRDYIRMPHAWGVAILSQIVAVVATAIFVLRFVLQIS